jgi:hypothetical protein
MITIPDNPTLEWAEEQADKLVLAQWAIFKDLEKLCGLAGGFQPAERSLISQYLVFGRHSFPKEPGDWPGITDRQLKERIDELDRAEHNVYHDLGELAMLAMPSRGRERAHAPAGERGRLMQHLLRFWTREELDSARTTAGMRRFFEDES